MADFDDGLEDLEELEDEGPSRPGQPKRPRGRFFKRKFVPRVLVCAFCVDKNAQIDYKQPEILHRYMNDRGKIRPRRQTGACARHQRQLAQAIKRARHLAMLPFVLRTVR